MIKNKKKIIVVFLAFIFFQFFCLYICYLLLPLPSNINFISDSSLLLLDKNKKILFFASNNKGELFLPINKNELPAEFEDLLFSAEDRYFQQHFGVNPVALLRAFLQNIFSGKRISGASTITMQYVRIKTNLPRTYWNKFKEALWAIRLEKTMSKNEILLAYLNHLPMGGNIVGVQAGAYYYFGKGVKDLSLNEQAMLIGIPQSPSRLRPDKNLGNAIIRKNRVLEYAHNHKKISKSDLQLLQKTELIILPCHNNVNYLSLVSHLLEENRRGLIVLDFEESVLGKIRGAIAKTAKTIDAETDGAVLIYDAKKKKFIAIVDYYSSHENFYISNAQRAHLPGSLLKPFIYAEAYESGLAWPDRMFKETDQFFSDYHPENMDHLDFRNISAQNALRLSRNVPAVQLLKEVSLNRFKSQLVNLQIYNKSIMHNPTGLSLALGSEACSFLNLVKAYSVFISKGNHEKTISLYSPSTIDEIKMSLPFDSQYNFHFKTGTSSGPRDLNCIGFDENLIVGIWLGKTEGGTLPYGSGLEVAYPLVSKIFAMMKNAKNIAPTEMMGVIKKEITLCKKTGYKALLSCDNVFKFQYNVDRKNVPFCVECGLNEEPKENFRILKPVNGSQYILRGGSNNEVYACVSETDQNLSWYLNGERVYVGKDKKIFLQNCKVGFNTLGVIDESDMCDQVSFTLLYLNH